MSWTSVVASARKSGISGQVKSPRVIDRSGGRGFDRQMTMTITITMSRFFIIAVAALLLLAGATAGAEELIAEFKGGGNRTTAEFQVRGPWILDWRINSEYARMLSFDLDLVDGRSGVLKGSVLRTKSLGNGVRLFNDTGSFRFRINGSFIDWHLKIKQLTVAEAALYKPK